MAPSDNFDSCYFCGHPDDGSLQEHHIIPRRLDPPDHINETVMLCSNCHQKQHAILDPLVDYFADEDVYEPSTSKIYDDNNVSGVVVKTDYPCFECGSSKTKVVFDLVNSENWAADMYDGIIDVDDTLEVGGGIGVYAEVRCMECDRNDSISEPFLSSLERMAERLREQGHNFDMDFIESHEEDYSRNIKSVKGALREIGGKSTKEDICEISGLSKDKVTEDLNSLMRRGEVIEPDRGEFMLI